MGTLREQTMTTPATPTTAPTTAAPDAGELAEIARGLRRDILTMTTRAGSGHPSSSMSAIDIVTALYCAGILRHDPQQPQLPDRDRFILSKGHASPALYAILAQQGYFRPRPAGHPAPARQPARRAPQHAPAAGRRGLDGVARTGPLHRPRARPARPPTAADPTAST